MTRKLCRRCWTTYGRELWSGSCICTGDVKLIPDKNQQAADAATEKASYTVEKKTTKRKKK